jgi:hypothetical protein
LSRAHSHTLKWRYVSDSGGDTVQTYEYSVYGQVAAEDANHPNPYMFTGRRFDIEIGLYYYRSKYYGAFMDGIMGKALADDLPDSDIAWFRPSTHAPRPLGGLAFLKRLERRLGRVLRKKPAGRKPKIKKK